MRDHHFQKNGVFCEAQNASPSVVRYQTVCTEVEGDAQNYFTYGLQCLGGWQGTWVQLDVIEDVSPRREDVLCLATKFNMLNMSPIHFRDAVLDSVNG